MRPVYSFSWTEAGKIKRFALWTTDMLLKSGSGSKISTAVEHGIFNSWTNHHIFFPVTWPTHRTAAEIALKWRSSWICHYSLEGEKWIQDSPPASTAGLLRKWNSSAPPLTPLWRKFTATVRESKECSRTFWRQVTESIRLERLTGTYLEHKNKIWKK